MAIKDYSEVKKLIEDNDVVFADLRFTDTKGKSSIFLYLFLASMRNSSSRARCLTVLQSQAGVVLISQT